MIITEQDIAADSLAWWQKELDGNDERRERAEIMVRRLGHIASGQLSLWDEERTQGKDPGKS